MTRHHCISTVLQLQNRGTAGHVCPHDCTAISSHSFSVAILSLSFSCVHSVYSFFRLFFFFALSFVCFILGADLPASSPSLATAQPPAQPPPPARPPSQLSHHPLLCQPLSLLQSARSPSSPPLRLFFVSLTGSMSFSRFLSSSIFNFLISLSQPLSSWLRVSICL